MSAERDSKPSKGKKVLKTSGFIAKEAFGFNVLGSSFRRNHRNLAETKGVLETLFKGLFTPASSNESAATSYQLEEVDHRDREFWMINAIRATGSNITWFIVLIYAFTFYIYQSFIFKGSFIDLLISGSSIVVAISLSIYLIFRAYISWTDVLKLRSCTSNSSVTLHISNKYWRSYFSTLAIVALTCLFKYAPITEIVTLVIVSVSFMVAVSYIAFLQVVLAGVKNWTIPESDLDTKPVIASVLWSVLPLLALTAWTLVWDRLSLSALVSSIALSIAVSSTLSLAILREFHKR